MQVSIGNGSDNLHEKCVEAVSVIHVRVGVILKFILIGLKVSCFKYAAFCDTSYVQFHGDTSFATLIILRSFYFAVEGLWNISVHQP
jgi:hypothetical protein